MIKSMTGFGKSDSRVSGKTVTVEIRSLNSRQLDISMKMPAAFRVQESEFRNEISKRFIRGKIDLIIQSENDEGYISHDINTSLLKLYTERLAAACEEIGAEKPDKLELVKLAVRMPEIFSGNRSDPEESDLAVIFNTFTSAAEDLDHFRISEGKTISEDIENRVAAIEELLNGIGEFENKRTEAIRERLERHLGDFIKIEEIDRNRLEQELIFYLEKLDITEEKIRLRSHIEYFRETLGDSQPTAGKKLGFISQEIGREINTLGSKANDFNIQRLVVQMKDELEKIKEQALNIL